MDKAQSIETIKEWINRNKRIITEYNNSNEEKLPMPTYILTKKKFDGLTINCTYDENGILVKGATKGYRGYRRRHNISSKTIKIYTIKNR